MNTYNQKKTNLFTGIIGAVLGAAIGAAAWMLVARADIVSSYVGLLIALLSGYGYDLFRGPKSNVKIFVLIICVILAVVAGTYGDIYWEGHDLYEEQFGMLENMGISANSPGLNIPSESEYIRELLDLPENKDVITENLATGLGFAALGCVGVIIANFKSNKKRKAEEAARAQAEYEQSVYAAYAAAPAYDPNAYAAPAEGYAEGYAAPAEDYAVDYAAPAEGYADGYAAAAYDENGYPVESAPAETGYAPAAYSTADDPAPYAAPAATRPAADDGYSAEYKFSSMRTAASTKPAAQTPPKKNPFVKPEFSNSFNAGKASPAKPADTGTSSKTFYSDK